MTEPFRSIRAVYASGRLGEAFGSIVQVLPPNALQRVDGTAEKWVDVAVVGMSDDRTVERHVAALEAAAAAGIPTVAAITSPTDVRLRSMADIRYSIPALAQPGDRTLTPFVDVAICNPRGSVSDAQTTDFHAIRTTKRTSGQRRLRRLLLESTRPDDRLPVNPQVDLKLHTATNPDQVLTAIDASKHGVGVIDHGSLHEDDYTRAALLANLAAAGVPVANVDGPTDRLTTLLGPELNALLRTSPSGFLDSAARDANATRARRIAMATFTPWVRWRQIVGELNIPVSSDPRVTVLLATKRPEHLRHALAQIGKQQYKPMDAVVVFHGDDFDSTHSELVQATVPSAAVVTVSSTEAFGRALNEGLALVEGDLVTKFDDDDWYGAEHVMDLVTAMEYSGAEVVGKAAEWVYLDELDMTLRRSIARSETDDQVIVAGGATMIRTADLRRLGGYRRALRHVDLGMTRDAESLGFRRYRTQGFGFLLVRHGTDHTWGAEIDGFLRGSTTQTCGLDLAAALIDSPAAAEPRLNSD